MASKPRKARLPDESAIDRELRGMNAEQIKALQAKIGVNPDGKVGGGTVAAVARFRAEQAQAAGLAAEKAAADVQRAKAEAAKATADAKRIEAQAQADAGRRAEVERAAKFAREQAKAERKAREATIGGAASLAAATAGVVIGKAVIAKGLDNRFQQSIEANQKPIAELAKDARAAMKDFAKTGTNKPVLASRMKAMGQTARRSMPAARSPLGVGFAASAAVLGGFSLYRGQTESEFVSRLAFNTSAGLELGVAVGTIGQQVASRANPIASIPMKDLADIRAAGEIGKNYKQPKTGAGRSDTKQPTKREVKLPPGTAKATASTVAKIAKGAGKVLPVLTPVAIGLALGSGITSARAASSRGDTMGVAKAGVDTVADIANTLTFGVTGLMTQGLRYAPSPRAKAEAAFRSQRDMASQAANGSTSDGMVAAHTRRVGTQVIRVDSRQMTTAERTRNR
jgi:trimeric autotransporter adhesin